MKNCVAFQTQLASIMEVLAKAAVAEISELVEEGSVVLRLEVSRSHKEIDGLRRKLQQVESELRSTQEAAAREIRSIGVQVEDQFGRAERDTESAYSDEGETLQPPSVCSTHLGDAPEHSPHTSRGAVQGASDAGERPPFEQRLKEKKFDAQTHDTGSVSGFTVKAEQEEEHVARRLNQTGCEPSAGRLNNLGSEYVMYERDSQLWTSFTQEDSDIESDDPVCSEATEQSSLLQHTPATMEVSGNTLPSLGKDVCVVDGGLVKEEADGQCVYSEENSSEMGGTQQTEYRQPPLSMNDNLTSQLWQPLQQPPLDWQIGVAESITDPNSKSNQKNRIHWRTGVREKAHSCTQCQKGFDRFIDLERHQRIHTGEKPFSCAQCGKRFSLRCNLITHERVHSGNKPFACAQCGKRFAQGSNLRAHHRIHTGERPYHCTQCGKSFTQLSSLKTHQKVHNRNELLEFGINCM